MRQHSTAAAWRLSLFRQHIRFTESCGAGDQELCRPHFIAESVRARSGGDVHCNDFFADCETDRTCHFHGGEDSSGGSPTQRRQSNANNLVAGCGLDQSHSDLLRRLKHREEFSFGCSDSAVMRCSKWSPDTRVSQPGCRVSPSSQAPLLGPGPLRTGRETFVLIRLKPFERLFQGDAVSIRKYVGGEPCRGTLNEAERGYLHLWNHPTGSASTAGPSYPRRVKARRPLPIQESA